MDPACKRKRRKVYFSKKTAFLSINLTLFGHNFPKTAHRTVSTQLTFSSFTLRKEGGGQVKNSPSKTEKMSRQTELVNSKLFFLLHYLLYKKKRRSKLKALKKTEETAVVYPACLWESLVLALMKSALFRLIGIIAPCPVSGTGKAGRPCLS